MADASKSPDIESADPKTPILNPLLLLLAARRGFNQDSRFTTTKIPEDYIISYRGRSGVNTIDHTALWVRFMWALACYPKPLKVGTVMSTAAMLQCLLNIYYEDSSFQWQLLIIVMLCVFQTLFLILCRVVANRHVATATPSWCDPESYQCRLAAALGEADIQYANIQPATLGEMETMWKFEQTLCEKFRIEGLVDPNDRHQVYDIVVNFYNSGAIIMQFPSLEDNPKSRPGILISDGEGEKL